ncbi:MAG: ATPase domain-containing protein [Methanobacteriota archaeon]
MTVSTECPECNATNKPNSTQCRRCGRPLTAAHKGVSKKESVVLERVMSGEVFTAVLGENTTAGSEPAKQPEREGPQKEAREGETTALKVYAKLLRSRGGDSSTRFERYLSAKTLPGSEDELDADFQATESANEALKGGRISEALHILEEAQQRGIRDPLIWLLLGEASLRLGRILEAGGAFFRFLELRPKDAQGWFGLAQVLRRSAEPGPAMEALDRTLTLSPDNAEAWGEKGLVLDRLGRPEEALRSLARCLELRPDQPFIKAKRLELESKLLDQVQRAELPREPGPVPSPRSPAEHEAAWSPALGPGGQVLLAMQGGSRPDPRTGYAPARADGAAMPRSGAHAAAGAASGQKALPRPQRLKTYVEGLDDLLHGGIPWGHVILVQGLPGTMKSSLCLSILFHQAALASRRCLYLSFEERTPSLMAQMASLGLHLDERRGNLMIVDREIMRNLMASSPVPLAGLKEAVSAIHTTSGIDLLVIDCLQAIDVLTGVADRRPELQELFDWLRDLDVTSFIVTEGPDWTTGSRPQRHDEYYLADGIIQLRISPISEQDEERQLRIVKMRGTKHETGYHALVLDRGRLRIRRTTLT